MPHCGALCVTGARRRRSSWRSTDGATWQQVADPAMFGTYETDIAWGPAGFVAIGSFDGRSASVWHSSNGLAWEQAPPATALSGFCPRRIAGGPKGYVAVGSDCGTRPVTAISVDGRSWVRAPGPPPMAGVVAGGPGWIGFGSFTPTGSTTSGTAVWTSPDRLAWRRTSFLRPLPPFVPDCGNPYDTAAMSDIARFGPSYVAVRTGRC